MQVENLRQLATPFDQGLTLGSFCHIQLFQTRLFYDFVTLYKLINALIMTSQIQLVYPACSGIYIITSNH